MVKNILLENEIKRLKLEVAIISETLRLVADHLTPDQKSAIAQIQKQRTKPDEAIQAIAATADDDYGASRLKQITDERNLRQEWTLE